MEIADPFTTPPPDFFLRYPDRRWPAWKFDMAPEDIFTTLPRQYNSITFQLLDPAAFSKDVSYASSIAHNREHFLQLLESMRDTRQKELSDLWLHTFRQFSVRPRLLGEDNEHWSNAMYIYNSNSFDSLVRFFAEFLPLSDRSSLAPRPNVSQIDDIVSNISHISSKTPTPTVPTQERMPVTRKSGNRVQKYKNIKDGPRRSKRLQQKAQRAASNSLLPPITRSRSIGEKSRTPRRRAR